MNINYYKKLEPFSLNKEEKRKFFEKEINSLTLHHYKSSKANINIVYGKALLLS